MSNVAPQRILVVDDEPAVGEALSLLLAYDGHRTEYAPSGEAALTRFKPQDFDLVITDFRMPGMKGDQLASAIKQQAGQTPVILLTAFPPARLPSAIDWMTLKPFTLADLRKAIAHVVAQYLPAKGKAAHG